MKFKICHSNPNTNNICISVNATATTFSPNKNLIECPDDPLKHVYYPIPEDLKSEVVEYLNNSLLQEKQIIFAKYEEQIRELLNQRKNEMSKLRTELNPKILNKLHSFKEDHPELFI